MGLTRAEPVSNGFNLAATLALPPRMERNDQCYCGRGRKYKRCCYEQDESMRRQLRSPGLPAWILNSRGKLQQFEKYACNVFALPELLASLLDARRAPEISTFDVINSLLHTALLRIPSLNALEGDLKESDFQKLIGRTPTPEVKAFSADVGAKVLDKLHLGGVRRALAEIIAKAERNKGFREGSYGALRCVAMDGWEPFASYARHCAHCLVRHVQVQRAGGEVEEVKQYYHRYVVAMLLGPVLDVVLAVEPVRNEEAHGDPHGEPAGHEGELTTARRLLDCLHQTYAGFIDAIVVDALYANGPWMTQLDAYGYGGFIVLQKENNEPLKEALALWQSREGCEQYDDLDSQEHLEFWDVDDIDTLDTYQGKLRVIRAIAASPTKHRALGVLPSSANGHARRPAEPH